MSWSALPAVLLAATLMLPALAGADGHIQVTIIVDDHGHGHGHGHKVDDHHHGNDKIHPAYRPDSFHRPRVVIHDHIHRPPGHHHLSPPHHGKRAHHGGHHESHGRRTATVNMP